MAGKLAYTSKINKIRSFALILIFVGFAVMYGGILAKKIEWLMLALFLLGLMFILLSCVIYLWIGMLSTRAVPIVCPSCEKRTKMLGRVDACMHCKQPLTLDKDLEGKIFDERYNNRKFRRQAKADNEE
ncbi:YgzB family protein [Lentibacillus halophilus]|uniref:YgzB family protein n=1 Tax=Lentibacillus halophilus TaxID=295065 RepID=A0ABN0ZAL2_9BACI